MAIKEIEYFRMPLAYNKVTQKYSSSHKGIDLAHTSDKTYGGVNAPVLAPFDATVNRILWSDDTGHIVELKHDYNGYTWFCQFKHLKSYNVKKGQKVAQGEEVGKMGSSGKLASGVHLHYALFKCKKGAAKPTSKDYVNPLSYTYAYDDQVVKSGKATIKRAYGIPVARNEKLKQINVIGDLNCRKAAKGTVLGSMVNGIYSYSATKKAGAYTWYKVATERWVAGVKNKVTKL